MNIDAITPMKQNTAPNGWRSVLGVREQSGFYELLSSIQNEDDLLAFKAAAAPYKELTPMMRYLQERFKNNTQQLKPITISDELLKELKAQFDPAHMSAEDLEKFLDALVENNVITKEEKEEIYIIPYRYIIWGYPSDESFDIPEYTNAIECIDAYMEHMGRQLAWTQDKEFVEYNHNLDPTEQAIGLADWLDSQIRFRNFLQLFAD